MNRTTRGVALALATALISGVAIFVNSYAVKEIADAALFTTLKNSVAALALLGVTVLAARRPLPLPAGARTWMGMTLVGVFGGGVAFLLFFSGLAMASAPSAAFIHKTLFVWVALLAVPFLGERLGWRGGGDVAGPGGGRTIRTAGGTGREPGPPSRGSRGAAEPAEGPPETLPCGLPKEKGSAEDAPSWRPRPTAPSLAGAEMRVISLRSWNRCRTRSRDRANLSRSRSTASRYMSASSSFEFGAKTHANCSLLLIEKARAIFGK